MSDTAMADFMRITDSFSDEELVSAISILTEKLKNFLVKENTSSLEDDLLSERAEIRSKIASGTLKTYSTMEEYRRAQSL